MSSPLPPPPSASKLAFPQEIINYIIDSIASENDSNPPSESFKTLLACSLVSKAFYFQSRRQLFSDVTLICDPSVSNNVLRFLKVFGARPGEFHPWVQIRTFSLVVTIPRQRDSHKLVVKLRNIWSQLLGDAHRGEKAIATFLHAMGNSRTLQKFNVLPNPKGDKLSWTTNNLRLTTSITKVMFSDSLKSIALFKLTELPRDIIADLLCLANLRELILRHVLFDKSSELKRIPRDFTGSSLERLELTDSTFRSFNMLLSTSFPHLTVPSVTAMTFPNLKAFSVSIPFHYEQTVELWAFIESLAASLETLELMDFWPGPTIGSNNPFHLCRLKHLRNLVYRAGATSHDYHNASLWSLSNLMMSLSTAVGIINVVAEIFINSKFPENKTGRRAHKSFADVRPGEGWTAIDTACSNPKLTNLEKLSITLVYFYHDPNSLSSSRHPHFELESQATSKTLQLYLPCMVTDCPSISVDSKLLSAYSPFTMFDYVFVSGQSVPARFTHRW